MPDALLSALESGIPAGSTLAELVADYQRLVVEATLAREPTAQAAADALGLTREGLWKMRRRLGLPEGTRNQPRPIPDDFRERLERASSHDAREGERRPDAD